MDIKLRARLSAYSKLESISGLNSNIPTPDVINEGHVLGVNDKGQYTLFPKIDSSNIDELFKDISEPEVATKDEIDNLFETSPDIETVTKDEIDKLFEETKEIESVDKEDIDKLFTSSDDTKIGTVSFAEIDSLFK